MSLPALRLRFIFGVAAASGWKLASAPVLCMTLMSNAEGAVSETAETSDCSLAMLLLWTRLSFLLLVACQRVKLAPSEVTNPATNQIHQQTNAHTRTHQAAGSRNLQFLYFYFYSFCLWKFKSSNNGSIFNVLIVNLL